MDLHIQRGILTFSVESFFPEKPDMEGRNQIPHYIVASFDSGLSFSLFSLGILSFL